MNHVQNAPEAPRAKASAGAPICNGTRKVAMPTRIGTMAPKSRRSRPSDQNLGELVAVLHDGERTEIARLERCDDGHDQRRDRDEQAGTDPQSTDRLVIGRAEQAVERGCRCLLRSRRGVGLRSSFGECHRSVDLAARQFRAYRLAGERSAVSVGPTEVWVARRCDEPGQCASDESPHRVTFPRSCGPYCNRLIARKSKLSYSPAN